jgi:phage portal protein BeeE
MRLWPSRGKPETRGTTQDYVDAVLQAREFGYLQTTMGTLNEEQVTGSYAGLVKSSGPVFALTLARMQVFSQARFQWTRFNGGTRGDLFGSPDLRILEHPWAGGTTADLLARMEMDVTTSGNAFIRRLRPPNTLDRLVRLRPEWVKVILGSNEDDDHPADAADVEVVGYAYLPPYKSSEKAVILELDECAHYAPYPDPDFIFIGMSWITPVVREVFGDNLMVDHKRAFLRNAATPNMVIKFDANTTVEQIKTFRELFEQGHEGAWNAYKTLYLGGGADVSPVGANFQQLTFAEVQGKAESRLASAAGVPPSWVGFSEGLEGSALNAGNFGSARRRFSDGTMQHLWTNGSTSLQPIMTPPDRGASLWFDTSSAAFMREDAKDLAAIQQQQAETITALVRDGFTAESSVKAVLDNDWSQLVHTGLTSVQLQPPSNGQEPDPELEDGTKTGEGT